MVRPVRSSCSSRPSSRASPISTWCTWTMLPEASPGRQPGAARAGAILEVDLGAIVANWRRLGRLHPPGPAAAVVKADGYGLGARHVAPALHAAGCRHFFVALLDEALVIRDLAPG